MAYGSAYTQLLTLIAARSQNWLRLQIEVLEPQNEAGGLFAATLAEMFRTARVCGGFRGTEAPLESFLRRRFGPCPAELAAQGRGRPDAVPAPGLAGLADRLARMDALNPVLLAEAEAALRQPIPAERLTDGDVIAYGRILALCYGFGARRPRFVRARTYGDAFETCLRMAGWAERKGRLMPLAWMVFGLHLIDPDHDATAMLADMIASQRPDGSFPPRLGFGTTDGTEASLEPTMAVLLALHAAIHRRWNSPPPRLAAVA